MFLAEQWRKGALSAQEIIAKTSEHAQTPIYCENGNHDVIDWTAYKNTQVMKLLVHVMEVITQVMKLFVHVM